MKNKTSAFTMLVMFLFACAGVFYCAAFIEPPYSYIISAVIMLICAVCAALIEFVIRKNLKNKADTEYRYAIEAFGSRAIKLDIAADRAYDVDSKSPCMGESFVFSKRVEQITEKMQPQQAEEVRKNLSLENIASVIKSKQNNGFVFKGSVFDDEIRWYSCDIRPCNEKENTALIIFKDVEEEKQKQDEIRRRAETDSLTGLLNRGAFEEYAQKVLDEKCTEETRYVYILMDIDNFKEINDTEGHPGGDRILIKTAQNLKALCAEYTAAAGRLGGDEFALLLPAPTNREGLNKLCGGLLAAVNTAGGDKTEVTASIGICLAPKDGTDLQQLYSRADVAMYQAKLNGKNRCCFFNNLNLHKDTKALMARLRERSTGALMPTGEFEENNYLEYVFSTLYRANNTSDAMADILEFTVRYFACECAYTVMPNADGKRFKIGYEWCKQGACSSAKEFLKIPCDSCTELYALLRKNGVYSSQSYTSLPPAMRDAFIQSGTTGAVMLPLWDGIEKLSGIIVLEVKDIARGLPTKEEIRALRLAGRVVSSFLIQSYSQQLLNENFAATKSVIDSIPTGIYVISKKDRKLMFFNKEAELSACGKPQIGEYCYKAFYGLDKPCENCPADKIPIGEKSVITSFSTDDNKRHMQMAVNETRWKAGRPAYILTAFNQLQTAEEKEQQRRDKRYRLALRDVYRCVCEIDPYSGMYQVFTRSEQNDFSMPQKGIFEQELKKLCDAHVCAEDRINLYKSLALDKLSLLQSGDIHKISCDFRINDIGGEEQKTWYNASAVSARGENGSPDSIILFVREIEQQKRAERLETTNELLKEQLKYKDELAKSEKRYRTIAEQTGTMVFEWASGDNNNQPVAPEIYKTFDLDQKLENGSVESVLKLLGTYPVLYGEDEPVFEQFENSLDTEDFYKNRVSETRVRLKTRADGYRWYKIAVTPTDDETDGKKHFIATLLDVDEQTKAYNTLKYQAEFDSLTGIYSYDKFCTSVQALMHRNYRSKYAIISFDIDKFKLINDLYGIDTGDDALRHIGNVLLHNLPRHSRCARIHSDVFCMAVPYISRQDIITLVRRLATKFSQFSAGIQLSAFFGIYLVEDINTPVSLMLDRAHLAKHSVKGSVVKRFMFYEDDIRAALLEEQNIERDMYGALANHEFVVYLQPKYNLDKNAVCGAEALVRWQHPTRGLLLPGKFIPVLERNGFIMRVDEYVWEEACRIMRSWIDKGLEVLPISVNVSRLHIHSTNFVSTMQALVKKYDLKPEMLHLELTETLFFENSDRMLKLMTELRNAGFVLEMDDFGSGYSSLNMLRKVPVDAIKIDKGFLDETISSDKGQVVVSHTVAMAKELRLTVIAEGVETKEQMDYLRLIECDDIQGFYIAKPIPQQQFEEIFLQRDTA